MKARVEQDLCIGCEACPELCPKVFAMYPNSNFAHVLVDEIPVDSEDCARDAAETCPVNAIIIED